MGPPSYMRYVVDRNVVIRRIPVYEQESSGSELTFFFLISNQSTRYSMS